MLNPSNPVEFKETQAGASYANYNERFKTDNTAEKLRDPTFKDGHLNPYGIVFANFQENQKKNQENQNQSQ